MKNNFPRPIPADPDQVIENMENRGEVLAEMRRLEPAWNPRFVLKTESHLLRLAHANSKIQSLSNSRTRILAHQVESTHRIVNALRPRFLIADEVGLGKTIEAGLVIRELAYRHDYNRILIVCPASLVEQWRCEMQCKFNDAYEIMDAAFMRRIKAGPGEKNPWMARDRLICSIDFIKNPAFAVELKKARWDSVIIDEAHRLRRDSSHVTRSFAAVEIIASNTKALLFLSATPFRGKLEELYHLIGLLDRNLLGPFHTFYEKYCLEGSDLSSLKKKISQAVIRRTKKEVGGFTSRHARTIRFALYPDERSLYDETTAYVSFEYNRAVQFENRAVGFVMTVFQKLLDSSTHALVSAFRKRIAGLESRLDCPAGEPLPVKDMSGLNAADSDNPDSFTGCHSGKTRVEIEAEIEILKRLAAAGDGIRKNKKAEKLKTLIRDLRTMGHEKFLIFTQFKTTQDFLAGVLRGYRVSVFNGSMSREEKEAAIESFRGPAEILISTEAGGEGRNLQFCSILINYDLPWSPLKIEQRIGRLHRFGQKSDVHVCNFSTRDTVAERVLEVLEKKLKLFEESIGEPDVMLGSIEEEIGLEALIMDIAAGRKSRREAEKDIDERLNRSRTNFEKLGQLVISSRMDFNYDEYYRITLAERRFSNNRIRDFFDFLIENGFSTSGIGRADAKTGLYPVRKPRGLSGSQSRGTFCSETALDDESLEFLAFGHPEVDSAIRYCGSTEFGGLAGLRVINTGNGFSGAVFYYSVRFESSVGREEIFTVLASQGGHDPRAVMDMERELSEQDFTRRTISGGARARALRVIEDIDALAENADRRLLEKINARISEIADDLGITLDPEIEKIKSAFEDRLKELERKLEVQEGRMKWYSGDLRGAVTRTKNEMARVAGERDSILEEYGNYLGVRYSIRMINAGIVLSSDLV